jgi:hypothetical protein
MSTRPLSLAAFLLCTSIPGAQAGEFWLSTGGGLDSRGLGAWQALTSAPLGRIDTAGPRLRAFLSESEGENSAVVEGGWSFGQSETRGEMLAGVEVRQEVDGKRLSPVVSAAFETEVGPGGISVLAMLWPAYGEVWAEVRPWLWLDDCWKLGVLAASEGAGAGFRAGVFTSGYRVLLPVVEELFLGGELGLERDAHGAAVAPYGGVNLGFGF